MTEPIPAADPVPYRALSGLAITGLILSGLFSGWLVLATVVALRTGTPLLIQPGWLLVPLAGAVISALGWLQIHRSEGSRVGVRSAQWGLLLGVVSPLFYGAWYAMTELPLRMQARDFTDAWFDDLRQSSSDERTGFVAFWCTLHPRRRDASFGDLSNPDEREALLKDPKKIEKFQESLRGRHLYGERGQKGELPLFFEQEVVRLVRQAEAEIEPLGVRDWTFVGGSEPGYRIEQAYRVRTPDGVFEITVPVLSLDSDRRRWRVLLTETVVTQREYTPRGRFLAQLQQDSFRFAADWVQKLGEGRREEAFLDTRPAKEREPLRRAEALYLLLDGLSMPPAGLLPLAHRELALPGYAEFAAGADVRVEPRIMGFKRISKLGPEMKVLFRPGGARHVALHMAPLGPNSTSPYELSTDSELIFYHPFEARLGGKYRCAGLIRVATPDKKLLAELESPTSDVLPERASAHRNRRWRLAGLRLLWGGEIVPARRKEAN